MKNIFFLFTIFSLLFISENSYAKNKLKHGKKKRVEKVLPIIPVENFSQINLTREECETLTDTECFRRDHMRDEPYYHPTRVTIFSGRIFAEQSFKGSEKSSDRLFVPIKNGSYKLTNQNRNLVSFAVKNGEVSDLKLLEGDLNKEKRVKSLCYLSEAIYGFHQAYDKTQIIERSGLFTDEYNFNGLKEFLFFVEKSNQAAVMMLLRNSNKSVVAIEDLRLCKMPGAANFLVKHISDQECKINRDVNVDECLKYSVCEDYMVVKDCAVLFVRDPMN